MNKKFVILLLLGAALAISAGCRIKTTVTAKDMDMSAVHNHEERKKRFYNFLRPVIESENNRIKTLRQSLMAARQHNNRKAFVKRIAEQYNVAWSENNQDWNKLLERVDIVPLQIVLAQSAIETNWGRSRFALEGNNFFGQWCHVKNCGMVPERRSSGKKHEVERYNSINASVRSYLKNINTTRAYYPLREIRRRLRETGQALDALALAGGLKKYSQRRGHYVNSVKRQIIKDNALMLGS
jgi:Bax protein